MRNGILVLPLLIMTSAGLETRQCAAQWPQGYYPPPPASMAYRQPPTFPAHTYYPPRPMQPTNYAPHMQYGRPYYPPAYYPQQAYAHPQHTAHYPSTAWNQPPQPNYPMWEPNPTTAKKTSEDEVINADASDPLIRTDLPNSSEPMPHQQRAQNNRNSWFRSLWTSAADRLKKKN